MTAMYLSRRLSEVGSLPISRTSTGTKIDAAASCNGDSASFCGVQLASKRVRDCYGASGYAITTNIVPLVLRIDTREIGAL
jgi:hypothetical protein